MVLLEFIILLGIEGFNVSLKRVQRLMTKLNLCAVTVKKYKPHSSKKVVEDLEDVLKKRLYNYLY